MLDTTLFVLIFSILLQIASPVSVKEYSATTSFQYISKTSLMYNGDAIWRLTPSSAYTATLYYLEVYWMTFYVQGEMPNCHPDYVEVFVKDTTTFRSIGKYCSSNTRGIRMKYMYSIGGEMLIRYKSTQNSNLYLRYRLRSRRYSYMGYYTSSTCYNTYSTSLTGTIYSSGYPRAYLISYSSCYYKIVTSSGKETRIVMMDFNLHCNHYVAIKGSYFWSSTYSSSATIRTFKCSSAAMVVTRYRYIHIRFYRYTGTSTSYRGFLLSYIAYDINIATTTQPGTCTFETDECGFIQSTTDHFNWIRRKGHTSSYDTGPSIDHTSSLTSGYYLYIEASNPRVLGHKSVISKQYSGIGTNGSCLTFWYHLYGSSMGQLNVYLKNKLQDASTSPSWNLIGEQGDRWEMGQVTLTKDRSVVAFEGVIGSSFRGDIAIDDISLSSGKCPSHVLGVGVAFSIQHRSGKLCPSWNKLNDELVLTNSCNELFIFTEAGSMLHIPSGKCPAPIAAVNNGVIKLQSACNSANAWFQHTPSKTIRHMRTGKCIQPYLGSYSPTIGTKLVISDGCNEARLQFDFVFGGIPVTTLPPKSTIAPSTKISTSTTSNKPSTTTNAPLTLSSKASTSTTATGVLLPTSSTANLGGKRENKSDNNNDNTLSISVIVISSIVCIILIVLAICFVTKYKRRRADTRESPLEYSNQNRGKATNIYFKEPTDVSRPFSLHGTQRPLPEIPQTVNKSQCQVKAMESTNDINSILRKQSLAIPAKFADSIFKETASNVCETSLCSVPTASVRSKDSARPASTKRHFQDVEENAFNADISNVFMPMKPLQTCAQVNQEEMYLDLDEIKENVEEYRSQNVYEPIIPTRSKNSLVLSRSMMSTAVSSMKETSSGLKSAAQANDECQVLQNDSYLHRSEMMSRMENLECTLSGILESIQQPINYQKKHSLPNLSQFNRAVPQRSRQGSCPSLKEPFLVANLAALESINEEEARNEEGKMRDEEEEDYLAPSQIHKPPSQTERKPFARDQTALPSPLSSSTSNSVPGIPTVHVEKLSKFHAVDKRENMEKNEEAVEANENETAVEMPGSEEQNLESKAQRYKGEIPENEECQCSVGEEIDENGDDLDSIYQPIMA